MSQYSVATPRVCAHVRNGSDRLSEFSSSLHDVHSCAVYLLSSYKTSLVIGCKGRKKKRNPTPPYFHNHNLNVRGPTRITHLLQSQPLHNLLPVSRPVPSDPIWRTETQHDGFIRLDTVTLIHTDPGSRLDRNRRKVGDRVLFTFITAAARTLATLSIINSLLSLKLCCVLSVFIPFWFLQMRLIKRTRWTKAMLSFPTGISHCRNWIRQPHGTALCMEAYIHVHIYMWVYI